MLTDRFYSHLAAGLWNEGQGRPLVHGRFFLALGRGEDSWDRAPIDYNRSIDRLVEEVIRKPVEPDDIDYLDQAGRPSRFPSARLRLQADFTAGEGEGTLRECGLFFNPSDDSNTSVLLSYFMHLRIEKGSSMNLHRQIQLDLTPRSCGPGNIVTRYLANSNSRELHDLDNEQPGCQINEIRFDRRLYFANPEQATALGYDHCAYCFGRDLSER